MFDDFVKAYLSIILEAEEIKYIVTSLTVQEIDIINKKILDEAAAKAFKTEAAKIKKESSQGKSIQEICEKLNSVIKTKLIEIKEKPENEVENPEDAAAQDGKPEEN